MLIAIEWVVVVGVRERDVITSEGGPMLFIAGLLQIQVKNSIMATKGIFKGGFVSCTCALMVGTGGTTAVTATFVDLYLRPVIFRSEYAIFLFWISPLLLRFSSCDVSDVSGTRAEKLVLAGMGKMAQFESSLVHPAVVWS